MQNVNDNDLIKNYLAGDNKSFETLISKHQQKVFTSIILLVKDQDLANDIFQDTFIKVIDVLKKGKYNDQGKFLPWVMRIAHNLCIDTFRAQKRMAIIPNKEDKDIFAILPVYDTNRENEIILNQNCQIIKELINELPEDQKEVVILRHYAELSFQEIATLTNVSVNTALGRMRYALLKLKKLIEQRKLELVD